MGSLIVSEDLILAPGTSIVYGANRFQINNGVDFSHVKNEMINIFPELKAARCAFIGNEIHFYFNEDDLPNGRRPPIGLKIPENNQEALFLLNGDG